MEVCNPNVNCTSDNTMFITDYICQGKEAESLFQEEENDARLSFPSGHASISGAVMGFLVIYLQTRRCETPACFILLKPVVQLGILILESWIAMTRVSDYYHHITDVICGLLLGTIIGILGGMHTTKWLNTTLCGAEEICDSETSEKNEPVCSSYAVSYTHLRAHET